MSEILRKCRRVVQYFHKSTTAFTQLKRKQENLLPPEFKELKLIQDVSTRWNSTFDMLQRLINLMPAVNAFVLDSSIKSSIKDIDSKFLFSVEEQETIKQVISLLKPFKEATENLSAENYPTLPALYPTLIKLKNGLTAKPDDSDCIKEMKSDAMSSLENATQIFMTS